MNAHALADQPITREWLTEEFSLEVGSQSSWLVTEINRPGCMVTTVRVLDTGDGETFMLEIAQHDPDDEPNWPAGIAFHVVVRGNLRNLVSAMEATA
jgi:hypothetical protein